VGGFCGALVGLIQTLVDPTVRLPSIVYWLLGSFVGATYDKVAIVSAVTLVAGTLILMLRWRINLLSLGEVDARRSASMLPDEHQGEVMVAWGHTRGGVYRAKAEIRFTERRSPHPRAGARCRGADTDVCRRTYRRARSQRGTSRPVARSCHRDRVSRVPDEHQGEVMAAWGATQEVAFMG
jgi:hypothetical protein